ncbi:class I SAM-dependent methyltransferase [Vibrio sp. S4M6]|uniref:class I SAM-dependent methyltransferase n=1 Tax=Vibrio sinus TaxID=2946865 RepID=UPI00202A0447|nr:class I SAM-dependent methyltransferase [Vibrio sinus]MCL9780586.1 class I SAM-dependent methyltransferase [Vibrio sinus]
MSNKLAVSNTWDIVAEGYTSLFSPMFERWARDSFDRVKLRKDDHVIDIACGPGTVSLLLSELVDRVDSYDFSENMLSILRKSIKDRSISNIRTELCDCQALHAEDKTYDVAFSQFGLMFFPDRIRGFAEMYRVLKPHGRAAVYTWAPHHTSSYNRLIVESLQAGFPELFAQNQRQVNTSVTPFDNSQTMVSEMSAAGFERVTVEPIKHFFPSTTAEQFWQGILKGSAFCADLKASTDPRFWHKKEKMCLEYLNTHLPGQELHATALLAIGEK